MKVDIDIVTLATKESDGERAVSFYNNNKGYWIYFKNGIVHIVRSTYGCYKSGQFFINNDLIEGRLYCSAMEKQ